MLGKDGVERLFVGHVDLVKVGSAAAKALNAVDGNLGRVVEAVDDDDMVAMLEEGEGGEGANVAGATARKPSGASFEGKGRIVVTR